MTDTTLPYVAQRDAAPAPRDDLTRVQALARQRLDEARPDAVARQRKRGRWTVREAIGGLADPDSFIEYGGLAEPATEGMSGAADGLVMGTAKVNGRPTDMVLYDYTVYAGTQSAVNHQKMVRMIDHAQRTRLPLICWLDGGGARPQDMMKMAERGSAYTFVGLARLSGWVPTVAIVPGRAFAGHANIAGLCDLMIAVRGAAIGMAGPPLVEAALGAKLTPEEIGPAEMHARSGVVDLLVDDEGQAITAARKYLDFFGPPLAQAEAPDPTPLRELVPENPRRAYNVRKAIEHIVDVGSTLELKPDYGKSVVTAFARLGGRTVGIMANQPIQLAGAIDSPASIKAARFVQICDAFDLPLLVMCDTPGLMVGPEAEKTGLVRHSARLLSALANATVPIMTVVLRKAYGLGRYVMGSRPFDPVVLLAWPTVEYGGMGMEGAVNIIYKRQLEAETDPVRRATLQAELASKLKEENTAIKAAKRFNYDDIIDPVDTRAILLHTLDTVPQPPRPALRKRVIEAF